MILPDVHSFLWSLIRRDTGAVHPLPASNDPVWDAILRDASEQGLISLLHQWSRESRRTHRLPPSAHNRLKAEMARLTAQNMVLGEELTAILRACRDRSLMCAPLRGMALAEQLYGEGTLRPAGDIDLLVRRQDLQAITELLTGLGYAGMEHQPGFAGSFSYTLEFVKDRHGWIVVEPHWTLAYPPFADALDMDRVWARCRKGRVAGIKTRLLSDEDLLVHLCFHIFHQGDKAPLLWWHEMHLLISQTRTSLNWDTIVAIAEQAGQPLFVAEVLRVLRDHFQTPIPTSVLARMDAAASDSPVTHLLVTAPRLNGREEFAQFVSLSGFRAKLRYAFGLLFPSPVYMTRRYGLTCRTQLGMSYVARLASICRDGLKWVRALLGATGSAKPSPLQ
jgi:hypothetical protein